MTYKHYILKNKKADCMNTWKEYLENENSFYQMMNPTMKEQHAKATFGTRFAIQYK